MNTRHAVPGSAVTSADVQDCPVSGLSVMRLGCGNGSRGELGAVGLTQNWAAVGGWEVGVKQACLV